MLWQKFPFYCAEKFKKLKKKKSVSCSYCRNINWNIKDTFDHSQKKKKKKTHLLCYTLSNDDHLWIKFRITKSYNRRTIYILKKQRISMCVCRDLKGGGIDF